MVFADRVQTTWVIAAVVVHQIAPVEVAHIVGEFVVRGLEVV